MGSERKHIIVPGRRGGKTQAAARTAPDGRLTYPPVEGEPDCWRCGLLRRFGTTPDDVLVDHLNGHRPTPSIPDTPTNG